jgi:hypothetical protein
MIMIGSRVWKTVTKPRGGREEGGTWCQTGYPCEKTDFNMCVSLCSICCILVPDGPGQGGQPPPHPPVLRPGYLHGQSPGKGHTLNNHKNMGVVTVVTVPLLVMYVIHRIS